MKLTFAAFRNMLREGLVILGVCVLLSALGAVIESGRARQAFFLENKVLTEQGGSYVMDEELGYQVIPKSEAAFSPIKKEPSLSRLGLWLFGAVLAWLTFVLLRFSYLLSDKGRRFYESLTPRRPRVFGAYLGASLLWAMLCLTGAVLTLCLGCALSPYLRLSASSAARLLLFPLINFLYLSGLLICALSERKLLRALPVLLLLLLFPVLLLQGWALSVRQTNEAFYELTLLNDTCMWWNRLPFRLFCLRADFPGFGAMLHYAFSAVGAVILALLAYLRKRDSSLLPYLFLTLCGVLLISFEFSREANLASRLITACAAAAYLIYCGKTKGIRALIRPLAAALLSLLLFTAAVCTAPAYLL